MKRCFYSMMAAMVLLLLSACSSDDELSRGNGNEALVSFNVELSGGMQTKAISDGATTDQLIVHVFDENGTYLDKLGQTVEVSNKKASVTINLVKGKTYSFLFWASAKDNSPYSFGADGKTITVNYDGAKANDESRDAFLGVVKDKVVEASFEENVTLKRPFAQINFLTDDIADAGKNELTIDENTHSSITLSKVATTLNPFTNTVGGFTEAEVIFGEAAIPALSETVTMGSAPDAKTYNYLGTAYFLVPAEGENPDAGKDKAILNSATLKIKDINGEGLKVENVPVQWNYRTNIYGSLLTATGDFKVTIEPDYDGNHDEEVKTKQVATVDQVDEAIENGATEVIVTEAPKGDATITIPKIFDQNNETTISISIPETTAKVTISEATESTENKVAPKEVAITAPTTNDLVINLPNSTVTLNGETYTKVTASTAANTLIIPEGVEVGTLDIQKGNVEIYGKVTGEITLADKCYINAYAVSTAEELKKAGKLVTEKKCKKIILKKDIDLQGSESNKWEPMDTEWATDFIFDGASHTISNLYVDNYTGKQDGKGTYYGGFFYVLHGTVKDLTIDKVDVKCFRGGALVGRMDYGTVENCHVKNATVNSIQKVAGLVGFVSGSSNNVLIKDCTVNNCTMNTLLTNDGIYQAGGLIGYLQVFERNVTIENNSVSGISFNRVSDGKADAPSYSNDLVYVLEQNYSHAFIGTIANLTTKSDVYDKYTVTLSNNTVAEQVSGIPTCDRTDDYIGWWAGEYNASGYDHCTKVVVNGVAKDRWVEVKRLMKQLRDGGDVIVWRNYDLTKWDGFKLDNQQITEGEAIIELVNPTNLSIKKGATLTVGKQQIINKSELTVTSEGTMSATDYVFMNEGSATLTIKSGTYNGTKATDANGVVIYNQGKCVIENGTFNGKGFTLMNTGSADMTINNGVVTNAGNPTGYALMAVGSGAKLTVTGGKIEAIQSIGGANVTISGGTIVNDCKYYALYNQGGKTTITGGYFSGYTDMKDIYISGGTVTIQGGCFEDNQTEAATGYKYISKVQEVDGITYNYEVVKTAQ